MNCALLEDNVVINVVWLHPNNVNEFPTAIPTSGIPVQIGDVYENGLFYRSGERVLTILEEAELVIDEKNTIIAELDAALLDTTYENILGGLEE